MAKKITIQLVGIEADREDVRLNDFIDQLKEVKKALLENELAITGKDTPTLDYKVVDLRHSSPATVVLEPVPISNEALLPSGDLVTQVVRDFATELRSIRKGGKLLHDPELERLRAYQKLGVRENNRITIVKIEWAATASRLTRSSRRSWRQSSAPMSLPKAQSPACSKP